MADTSTYKLEYFDFYGRGEPIRILFFLAGKEFEDVRYSFEEWRKVKPSMPLGQLPVLTVDGTTTIIESTAIIKYLGKKFDLVGNSLWDETVCDMVICSLNELGNKLRDTIYMAEVMKFTEMTEEELTKNKAECREQLIRLLKVIEGYQKPGKKFIIGDQISVADVFLYCGVLYGTLAFPDIRTLTEWTEQFVIAFEADDKIVQYLKIRTPSSIGF